jgi:hypothetical protein
MIQDKIVQFKAFKTLKSLYKYLLCRLYVPTFKIVVILKTEK